MGVIIPQVVTSDRASGSQVIDGSLKFNESRDNYLERTPGSAGNRRTWTWSCWVKKTQDEGFSEDGVLFPSMTNSSKARFILLIASSRVWAVVINLAIIES